MAKEVKLSIDGQEQRYPQWATEETLQEVAKHLGAKRSGVGSLDVATKKAAKTTTELTKAQKAAKTALEDVVSGAGSLAQSLFDTDGSLNDLLPAFETFTRLTKNAAKGLFSLGEGIPILSGFVKAAKIGADMAEETANVLFDVTTQLADRFAEGFRGAAQVGATLEGNFTELSKKTFAANMSLTELGPLLERAGPTLAAFTTSSDGARRVLDVLGKLNQKPTLETFTRLGFTIDELNDVSVDFLNILAQTGQTQMLQNMTDTKLAQVTGQYATNLAVLSRLTGQSRKELQQQMREEQMRANVQALLALKEGELDADQQQTFRTLQVGLRNFSPQLADAFASISTLGVASAEQEAILAQLGPTGDLIRQFATAFRDGTADVGDADIENILGSIADGITNDQTLRTALLSPAGGFPQALAQVVGDGLQFAQKFIAGDVSLEQLRQQVQEEREGRIEGTDQNKKLITSIIDAQTNLATFSKTMESAIINSEAASKIIQITVDSIDGTLDVIRKFVGFAETGEVEGLESDLSQGFKSATQYIEHADLNFAEGIDKAAVASGTASSADYSKLATDMVRDYGFQKGMPTILNDYQNMLTNFLGEREQGYKPTKEDFNTILKQLNEKHGSQLPMFQRGTRGIMDFGEGKLAALHGKEAVIPAPEGNIPVDLGSEVKNALASSGLNSVQSNAKLDEMISILKAIADGQIGVMKTQSRGFKRLGNNMSGDLYRFN